MAEPSLSGLCRALATQKFTDVKYDVIYSPAEWLHGIEYDCRTEELKRIAYSVFKNALRMSGEEYNYTVKSAQNCIYIVTSNKKKKRMSPEALEKIQRSANEFLESLSQDWERADSKEFKEYFNWTEHSKDSLAEKKKGIMWKRKDDVVKGERQLMLNMMKLSKVRIGWVDVIDAIQNPPYYEPLDHIYLIGTASRVDQFKEIIRSYKV